jgi:small subunit ribosomal protein S4e
LKYALTGKEVNSILMQRLVKIDGKVRTDSTFPVGVMDVLSLTTTNEHYRLMYDTKGRFALHAIPAEEAKYKLGKVVRISIGKKGIPYMVTHDGRTIRYPDPLIKINDTVKIDLETGKVVEFVKYDTGNLVMITGGRNTGRIGIMENRDKHDGDWDIIHVKDAAGQTFATRSSNIFIIGTGNNNTISLPRRRGVRVNILQEQEHRVQKELKQLKSA